MRSRKSLEVFLLVVFCLTLVSTQAQSSREAAAACFCLIWRDSCSNYMADQSGGVCLASVTPEMQSYSCILLASETGNQQCPVPEVPPTPSQSPQVSQSPSSQIGTTEASGACMCLILGALCSSHIASLSGGVCTPQTPAWQQTFACRRVAGASGNENCPQTMGSPTPFPASSVSPTPSSSQVALQSTQPAPSSSPIQSPTPSPSSSSLQSRTPLPSPSSSPSVAPLNGNPAAACLCLTLGASCSSFLADLTNGECLAEIRRADQSNECRTLAALTGNSACSLSVSPSNSPTISPTPRIVSSPSPSTTPAPSPSASASPSRRPSPSPSPSTVPSTVLPSSCAPAGDPVNACLCVNGLVPCRGVCQIDPNSYECQYLASLTGRCPAPRVPPPPTFLGTRIRKEIGDLTGSERADLVSAIRTLQTTPSRDQRDAANGLSIYDTFTRIHANFASRSHGVLSFLPWHREFLLRFENELRAVNPSVTLPYWDFTLDWLAPYLSPIFDDSLMGRASYGPIDSGAFRYLVSNVPSMHLVLRFMESGPSGSMSRSFSRYTPPSAMRRLVNNGSLTFEAFAAALEAEHAAPHVSVGGSLNNNDPRAQNWGAADGDLVFTDRSPSDPIFYLIHGGTDKFFADRQLAFPSRAREYDVSGRESLEDPLPGLPGATVSDGMDTNCVVYQPATRIAQNQFTLRTTNSRMGLVRQSETVDFESSLATENSPGDSRRVLRDMLLIPEDQIEDDPDVASRATMLGHYTYLNRMNPLPLFRGLKLSEEARLREKREELQSPIEEEPEETQAVDLENVLVNEKAMEGFMVAVEKQEEKRVLEYYESTARKPYVGIRGNSSGSINSAQSSHASGRGDNETLVNPASPIWRVG